MESQKVKKKKISSTWRGGSQAHNPSVFRLVGTRQALSLLGYNHCPVYFTGIISLFATYEKSFQTFRPTALCKIVSEYFAKSNYFLNCCFSIFREKMQISVSKTEIQRNPGIGDISFVWKQPQSRQDFKKVIELLKNVFSFQH